VACKGIADSHAEARLLGAKRKADISTAVVVRVVFLAHWKDLAVWREVAGNAINEIEVVPLLLTPRKEFGVIRRGLDIMALKHPIHGFE
jgi:hypothetical protein